MPLSDINSLASEHNADIDIGNTHALSSRIRIQFDIIQRELKLLPKLFDNTRKDCWKMREEIKKYLSMLNHQQDLPLYFRLEVMDFFQKYYASYFDSEYIIVALKSYQITIELLNSEGMTYRLDILRIAIAAITITILDLKIHRQQYQPIEKKKGMLLYSVLHHVFPFIDFLDDKHAKDLELLGQKVCQYVLLQRMDFFSKDLNEQKLIVEKLNQYSGRISSHFYTKGEMLYLPTDQLHSYLAIYPQYPSTFTKVITKFKHETSQNNMILLDLNLFLDQIIHLSKDSPRQDERNTCKLIRDSLLRFSRTSPRQITEKDVNVFLDLDATTAFQNRRLFKRGCDHDTNKRLNANWQIIDYSKTGLSLKNKSQQHFDVFQKGLLVGVQWTEELSLLDTKYQLGFLRWYKTKGDEEQIGIEFFKKAYMIRFAVFHADESVVIQEKTNPNILWVPSPYMHLDDSVHIYENKNIYSYRIEQILETGLNFSRCIAKQL
ncbi:MAG: hypothetical protein Q9M28_09435 [Mariprofundaceae bacterium]|nr:hypothetical protein [Mariprofundaceae bacterium]